MRDGTDFPLSEAEIAFLRALARAESRFLVVGVGAAVLQGADAVTQDLDLWFRSLGDPAIAAAARVAGGVFAARSNPPMIAGKDLDRIDLVVHCDGLKSFDAEYRHALDLPLRDFSVKLLPLERVLASKQAAGRPKDMAVLEALRAALAARRAAGRR
ncbi:MAG: hypothetical protein HY905_09415 [Deltaproteobacteria bacterium]|nr:hypothetical protein [Deltaproteobacteria bacterium]